MLLFFVNGGTATSLHSLIDLQSVQNIQIAQNLQHLWKPATTATAAVTTEAAAGDTHFHLPVPGKVVAAIGHTDPMAEAGLATAAASRPTTAAPATPAPAATPSKAVAAAASAMPAAPKVMSPAERFEANRQELERLAVWYDNLKHERGYLRKGDIDAVEAYNVEAAKYQAALQLAKNEQAELAKLTAKK